MIYIVFAFCQIEDSLASLARQFASATSSSAANINSSNSTAAAAADIHTVFLPRWLSALAALHADARSTWCEQAIFMFSSMFFTELRSVEVLLVSLSTFCLKMSLLTHIVVSQSFGAGAFETRTR